MHPLQKHTPQREGARDDVAVLIVGAGPTGLTLACELARRGVSLRIIDGAPGPQPGSRGKGIQPRSLEVFDRLGIADDLLALGRMAMPLRSTSQDGTVSLGGEEPEALADRPDIPYTTSLITPQWRVEETLRARLADSGAAVEFGTSLRGYTPSDDGVEARVTFDGEEEIIRADWLIGSDGGHSTVRKMAGIAFPGETQENIRMFLADGLVDGLARDAWHMWRSDEGFVSISPLPSTDLFQFGFVLAPGQQPPQSRTEIQTIIEQRTGRTDIHLHEPVWSSVWRSNTRLAEAYRSGRILLAGDAAHVHSPTGGQGMNTGIQDAHNLGWKLAAVIDGASTDLLNTYESERRLVASGVLEKSSDRLNRVLKDKGVSTRRDASTLQLDVTYRGSSLADDDREVGDALRAGDRAPDSTDLATVDGDRRLFDLIRGSEFAALDFGGSARLPTRNDLRVLHVVHNASGPTGIVDTAGHLAAAYEASDDTLVLIRPDGHIALISDAGDTGRIIAYLDRIHPESEASPTVSADVSLPARDI